MGRRSKLTPEQWATARRRWEGCDKPGFAWLREEVLAAFGDAPSRPAFQQMAADQGWAKGGLTSEEIPKAVSAEAPADRKGKGDGKAKVTDKPAASNRKVSLPAHTPREAPDEVADEVVDEPEQGAAAKPPGYKGTGRPSKYRPEFDAAIVAYFDVLPYVEVDVAQPSGLVKKQRMVTDPPMLAGFAKSIGVSMATVNRWASDLGADGEPRYPSFVEAYARARELNEAMLARGGLLGMYDNRVIQFVLKNLYGWVDNPVKSVQVAPIATDELDRVYVQKMEAARQRMAAIRAERASLLALDGDS